MKPLTDRVAYHTMKGRRASNQDAVVVGMMADGRAVAAVADGMGGRLGGDVASRRALEVVVERLGAGEGLTEAVKEANRIVFAESGADPELHGMGTTVVALVQKGEEYHIANVGDSRAYRLSGEGIAQVTADHSFTAEAVEAGDMTPEDAVHSPWANALTRAIGTDEDVEVDVFGPFDARESHAILLCSDGFHKPLSDDGILTSVLGCDAQDAAEELTDIALRAGSDDNITIALVSFGDRSWRDDAIRARQDEWEADDAPTVEFENDAEGWAEVEEMPTASLKSTGDTRDDERPPPEWILPDEDDLAEGPSGDGVNSGLIREGLAPMGAVEATEVSTLEALSRFGAEDPIDEEGLTDEPVMEVGTPLVGDEESSEVPARAEDTAQADDAFEVEDAAEVEDAVEVAVEAVDPADAEFAPESVPGAAPSEPVPGAAAPDKTRTARSRSKRRRGSGGFDLVVSPAKPQRRFQSRGILTPMALLLAIGAVVAVLIRFL